MVAPDELIGEKYRLLEPIGESKTVWKALHTTLQTEIAIKLVERARGEAATARFLVEAKAAGAVRHRNVVDIIDFGTTSEGEPFMALEYLVGETLRERLTRAPALSAAQVVDIAAHALSGLAAVHDRNIVHRDLRPENIFLVAEADGFFPKLLDFGISKVLAPDGGTAALTLDGVVLGAPEYIAPEQALGSRDIDLRADLFSMGVILYEALIGRGPFEGQTTRDILRRGDASDVPPIRSLRPELGDALSDVVAKAMAHAQGDRFADARTMRQALLEAAQTIDPAVLRAPGPARRSIAIRRSSARPAPPPKKSGVPAWVPALGVAGVIAIGLVVQLAVPGGWPVVLGLAPSPGDPGASGVIAPPDGGIVGAADIVAVTLRNVPPGAVLTVGAQTLSAEEVDARRSADRPREVVITTPRSAHPIELRAEAPGFRAWTGQSAVDHDVVVRVRLARERAR